MFSAQRQDRFNWQPETSTTCIQSSVLYWLTGSTYISISALCTGVKIQMHWVTAIKRSTLICFSPMSELQKASCGCVRAHEQPSVSWLTCRLLKTNSRLIRCWYTDCIFPNFPSAVCCYCNKLYGVRLGPLLFSAAVVGCVYNVQGSGWLLSKLLLASLERFSLIPESRTAVHIARPDTRSRPSPPLQVAGGAANQRPVMPSEITDAMTYWNFTLLRLIFPDWLKKVWKKTWLDMQNVSREHRNKNV